MRYFIALLGLLVGASLYASGAQGKKTIVGVSMPTKSSERWLSDGSEIEAGLKAKGYQVDLQYAEDVVENQLSQVENMITKGAKLLIIASVDGESLTNVLEKAHEEKIPVIAYDRLIRNSPYVAYYVTFDNYQVGIQQAMSLLEGIKKSGQKSPVNLEIFGGSPDDNNAYFFYNGAMSVLTPLINKGDLVVRSGQIEMSKVATFRWEGSAAQARMDNLLAAYYGQEKVGAVLSPYDGLSIGVIASLKAAGYGTTVQSMPIVTGQDAQLISAKAIIAGEQYSTIFKDTRLLAKAAVEMVRAIFKGDKVEVNDTTSYDNGAKIVPSLLLKSIPIQKENVKLLVENGYIKAEDLN